MARRRPLAPPTQNLLDLHAAAAHLLRTGDFRQAIPVISRLLMAVPHRHPARVVLWVVLSYAHAQLCNRARSLWAAEQALAPNPRSWVARQQLHAARDAELEGTFS